MLRSVPTGSECLRPSTGLDHSLKLVVSTLGRRLIVVPRAVIPGKYGSQRVVTCPAGVKEVNYIQAVGASDRMGSFDHTISRAKRPRPAGAWRAHAGRRRTITSRSCLEQRFPYRT